MCFYINLAWRWLRLEGGRWASPTSKEIEGAHHRMWFKVLLHDKSWRLLYLTKHINFRTKWNQMYIYITYKWILRLQHAGAKATIHSRSNNTNITKLNWFYHFAILPVFADRRDCQVNSHPSEYWKANKKHVSYARMLLLRIHWVPTVCDFATVKLTSKCNLLIQWHLTVQSLYFCVLIICLYIQPESYKPPSEEISFLLRENHVILSQKLWHTSTKRGKD